MHFGVWDPGHRDKAQPRLGLIEEGRVSNNPLSRPATHEKNWKRYQWLEEAVTSPRQPHHAKSLGVPWLQN